MFCFSVFLCVVLSYALNVCSTYMGEKFFTNWTIGSKSLHCRRTEHAFSAFNLSLHCFFPFWRQDAFPHSLFVFSLAASAKASSLWKVQLSSCHEEMGHPLPGSVTGATNMQVSVVSMAGPCLLPPVPEFSFLELILTWWHMFVWPTCVLKPDLPVSMPIGKKVFKILRFKQGPQMSDIRAAVMTWWRLENE